MTQDLKERIKKVNEEVLKLFKTLKYTDRALPDAGDALIELLIDRGVIIKELTEREAKLARMIEGLIHTIDYEFPYGHLQIDDDMNKVKIMLKELGIKI